MTIPLDRLYHYIESVAQDIRGDTVIIYRFFPHGSKKLEDLSPIQERSIVDSTIHQQIYCYDQEPLDYDRYSGPRHHNPSTQKSVEKYNLLLDDYNLCVNRFHIYDKHILLHSEQRSSNLDKYIQDSFFITAYYWSHAVISRDWFRYAEYDTFAKTPTRTFLIYNRAWSGTREYRLKFMDLIIEHELVDYCQTTFNPIEPELNIHYTDYLFTNQQLAPSHRIEDYITNWSLANSSASADYCKEDYANTEFEVVLETLFDDGRLHLTEKILRPIAVGQPFILAATHGSLKYLQSYGFKTFNDVIDESYDLIEDPVLRLEAIVKTMKNITSWSDSERTSKMSKLKQITEYNRQHFFSAEFNNFVLNELRSNLSTAITLAEKTNTSTRFINNRKKLSKYRDIKSDLLSVNSQSLLKILQRARLYYNKH